MFGSTQTINKILADDSTVVVSARQINEVAIELKSSFPLLSESYGELAVTVATKKGGFTTIKKDSPLAKEIRSLS